jgi:hypothetical protein
MGGRERLTVREEDVEIVDRVTIFRHPERVDLQHPLRSLIPSLDADVLEVLAAVQVGLGVSQITRRASRGSRAGITAVLDRMVAHGLVTAEPGNQGSLYRLNRTHILTPALLAAIAVRTDLLEGLRSTFQAAASGAAHVSVFGSFARGEAGPGSDIDVLLVGASEQQVRQWEDSLASARLRVEQWSGNRCQTIAISIAHLRRLSKAGEPIVKSWLDESVLLNGEPLTALIAAKANRRS